MPSAVFKNVWSNISNMALWILIAHMLELFTIFYITFMIFFVYSIIFSLYFSVDIFYWTVF